MGYDVHITRKTNWFDDEPQIDIYEWRVLVASDEEMRLDGYAEAKVGSGAVPRMESEGLAVWVAYSGHAANGNMAWFDFGRGDVVVKNPDAEILVKMWAITQKLGARVQGDDCELYGADGNVVT
ncbi:MULTISPECIES: hypothetical protein [unclassified Burkholderia]|uniref:hypothetical protein n=1 Tax=unclassified Burkholderia TaxID=2613784 RepID=UPI000753CDEB|nr:MULTISPECIES: hypothetical protein [unclassified Burkholderia]KUY92798.1 hypothetical protein WS49_26640 [Burkholderia sp. RF7-non_BP4]KUY95305.1 hypothetical protein WS48_18230 [Burkholderia sp. RF7-non_BP1]